MGGRGLVIGSGWMRMGTCSKFPPHFHLPPSTPLPSTIQLTPKNTSFADRAKDTLKISGMQVSPAEIESFLLSPSNPHPVSSLITDVAIAGVRSTQTKNSREKRLGEDELVPRAWVVPSNAGRAIGERELVRRVDECVKEGMSKYKWLRGGVEMVDEVRFLSVI